jgi:hypothetical protein
MQVVPLQDMQKKTAILFRAFLLLTVFFLNTVIGFACALQSGLLEEHSHQQHHHHDMHHTQGMQHDHKKQTHRCCGDAMVKFALVDKSQTHQEDMVQLPVFALLYPLISLNLISEGGYNPGHRYTVLRQYPPPADICIAIQSFRI